MSKYTYAKQNLPDWDEHGAAQLKGSIKAICLKAVLKKSDKENVFQHIDREINEFVDEFDKDSEEEQAIGERYRQELTEFAREAYEKAVKMVGGLSAYMFSQALVKSSVLTDKQKEAIGAQAYGYVVDVSPDVVKSVVDDLPVHSVDGYRRGTAGDVYYKEIHKQVTAGMTDYEEFKTAAARPYLLNVNQRNIVEMGVRFARYQEQKKRLIEQGVRLVYVPPHSNCSKRCQPYQGKIYSLTGQAETFERGTAQPIEDVADKVTVQGKKDPSRFYAAGLFAYNCRHTMQPYQEGQNIEIIPDDVIEKQRKLETEQRDRERKIRALGERYMLMKIAQEEGKNANLVPQTKQIRKDWLAERAAYRAFCAKNNIPRYDDRLKVISGENIYQRTSGKNDSLVKHIKI